MGLFNQGAEFFDLLEGQASAAQEAAQEFLKLVDDFSHAPEVLERMGQIEKKADQLTHDLVTRADATFITPFDKEDLHRLSVALDDLTDFVEAAAARIVMYHLDKPRPDFGEFVRLVEKAMSVTCSAVSGLRNLKKHDEIQKALIAVHTIEGEADANYRRAVDTLFGEEPADAIRIIKWKEIYDRLEMTTDRCEDVADMLETLAVKYG